MAGSLPKDATLRSILPRLSDADDFVCQAYGVLHSAAKEHGDVVMRLGVTGTGKLPNYRVDSTSGQPLTAIDGNFHGPWPDGVDFTAPTNWSSATMSKREVEELLGEIRRFKRKGSA